MSRELGAAARIFRAAGGTMRMSEALAKGINRRRLYTLRDRGIVTQLSRGVYRLASLPALQDPDLVTVSRRVPNGVICLISALAFHELTTEIPHAVDIAIERGRAMPRIDYPPVNMHQFSGAAFSSGIEKHRIDGQRVLVYSREKTIADAFKFREKLGLDVALEALKIWRRSRHGSISRLLELARLCRVERVIRPYLEAIT